MTTTNEYKCTICKDTGYVDDFYGNIANTCECAVQRAINARTQLWITESNTTTLDRERFTFDNFKPEKQLTKKGINDAKMLIKLLKSWQKREIKLLTIIGGVGIGKTHLSIATLVNTIQTKCEQGYYAPATEIAVKSREFEYNEAEMYRKKLQRVEWLVLDDVGVEHDPRGYMQTFYHSIIDHRYSQQMQTLITTNLKKDGKKKDSLLKRLGDRVVSRLYHKGVRLCFEADGQDIRKQD